ncbi:uncharacterized protein EKO05_0010907 [Ascochyta rabiei]|uniref:Uncharacterized protein n=1 Tax=Didymella rabiei TaxID=5454 RepID=A0A162ZIM2_DIDRA|nr:uncharacterized protein EKO05_0010907 [Ascochyta rabiei]KZM20620.1 hypothetical protein ST47_g8234 [Ascochyta rabiei]UPX20682.1 hypothetical protein EKO05_0010907 [Ascochyta rabiei]
MPAPRYYLQKAMATLLDCVWDPTAQLASMYIFEDMNPFPPKDTPPQDLIGHVWKKPVEDLLDAKDISLRVRDKARGHDFISTSASLTGILHPPKCDWRCQVRHSARVPTPSGFVEYEVQWQFNPDRYWGGRHRMPDHLPEVLRRALLMQNLCEWAAIVLKYSVEAIVKKIDPNSEVLWMAVIPRRRFQFFFGASRTCSTVHSVLLIRSRLAGNLVLDPTGEQYGIPREHRLLPWRVYKKRYVVSPGQWCGEGVWSTGTEAFIHGLEGGEDWPFWESVRDITDANVAAWLPSGDLRVVMNDEGHWKKKAELLERLVAEELYWFLKKPIVDVSCA